MAIPLLICDDSQMAGKQVERSLPENWSVAITFAGGGREALDATRAGKGDMVFLDLTLPGFDGYQVLDENLQSVVIVISGDIQPQARERVMTLGALEFIKKPINKDKLKDVLVNYGLL